MGLEKLSMMNIELGSLVEKADGALGIIGGDICKRPRVETARKVVITITVTPHLDREKPINIPEIDWEVSYKCPGHKGMTTRAYVEDEKLFVNTGDPLGANPNQATIFDGGEKDE